jgi:biopolymer transport protein ExbD
MAGGGALSHERVKRGKQGKRKKKKRVGFVLDMTPLVDITFLLLTFFMFTTTMATPQVMEMSMPPEGDTPVEVRERELMSLIIWKDGQIFWNIAQEPPEKITLKNIRKLAEEENLREEVRNKLITVLKVEENAPYGLVIAVLDELNLAELNITQEISKKIDDEGKPTKRQRRFTLAPLSDDDKKRVEEVIGGGEVTKK